MADVTNVVAATAATGQGELDAPPSSWHYGAFTLEQCGIELIPEAERPMKPSGLFWMWAGAIWNVEFVVYGALIVSFGLSYLQAVSAILVGNLAYLFLGWASLPGPETGTTTFMVSRAPFGRNGNRVPSLFNWITQVGFEIEGIVLVVLIVVAMFSHEGAHVGDPGKAVIIVLAVAIQFVVPFLGHATITRVLRSFFSNRTHGADFSWLFGLIVSAAAYYLLSASSVRKETVGGPTAVTPQPATADGQPRA